MNLSIFEGKGEGRNGRDYVECGGGKDKGGNNLWLQKKLADAPYLKFVYLWKNKGLLKAFRQKIGMFRFLF